MIKWYPVADRLTREDRGKLGLMSSESIGPMPSLDMHGQVRIKGRNINVMAKYSGEKRPPREGEWFLSGSTIAAYRAPNDLSMTYLIATLVLVEKIVNERVVELRGESHDNQR